MGHDITSLSALELSSAIRAGKLGVVETVNAYMELIKKSGKKHNSFLALAEQQALKRAKEVQAKISAGEILSPLAGVPIGLKDNISTVGIETNCASKMLEGYKPVYNATVVDRLEQAGLIVIGKLNMDEFAMGSSSETGFFGPVRNPWDSSRVAGGSSGGSAAAVAAGELALALGSDTGGSIRQPCSFCGVTGLKPTYGAVSRYGLIALASSLDQIGPLAQNIDDCAALLSLISGPDEKDSTCVIQKPFDFSGAFAAEGPGGLKIGLPRNYFDGINTGGINAGGINTDVKNAVLKAAKDFEEAGAKLEEFEMPLADYAVQAYYIIACAEASSNLSRFDGLKYGYRSQNAKTLSEVYRLSRSESFGPEVKRRIMLGSFVLSSAYYDAYYRKALKVRAMIRDAYRSLFERFDLILSPVAPGSAYKIGENIDDTLKMYMGDIYTAPVNLAGLPAAALPCGFDSQGLPVGFQLVADSFAEEKLINAARLYQARTGHHAKRPGGQL